MNLKNMLSDLILVSRLGATSAVEKKADALLKPARVLFGGRRIYVVDPQNMHVEKERIGSEPTKNGCGSRKKRLVWRRFRSPCWVYCSSFPAEKMSL
ncbi:MAG: hypothetical protein ACK5MA_00875 [Parachlamydiaceae bacterium]